MASRGQNIPRQLSKPLFVKLKDVLPGVHGYNTYVKIEDVQKQAITRYDGSKLTVAEGLCGDDTGVIRFRVIGEYANILEKGKTYAWRNGLSEVFQERQRLSLDQFGRITLENDVQVQVNLQGKKYSDIEYVKKVVPKGGNDRRSNSNRRNDRGGNRDNRDRRDNRDNRDNRDRRDDRDRRN